MAFEPFLLFCYICLGFVLAIITTVLYYIIKHVTSRNARILIPVIGFICLYPLTILPPVQPDNAFYPIIVIAGYFLTCMAILIPFPLFEKKIPEKIYHYAVFSGALITSVILFSLSSRMVTVPLISFFYSIPLLGPLVYIAISIVVFAGITAIIQVLIKTSYGQSSFQAPEPVQTSQKKDKWHLLKIIILLLIICSIPLFVTFGKEWFFGSDSDKSIILTPVDESVAKSGLITHISEKDFKEYPRLESAIRDYQQKFLFFFSRGTEPHRVVMNINERDKFVALYWSNNRSECMAQNPLRFFEYNGFYYGYSCPSLTV
ncbi:MAG: hypothetical protein WC379_03100 [Methanoregula sp.]|jgi:hypothetical protein